MKALQCLLIAFVAHVVVSVHAQAMAFVEQDEQALEKFNTVVKEIIDLQNQNKPGELSLKKREFLSFPRYKREFYTRIDLYKRALEVVKLDKKANCISKILEAVKKVQVGDNEAFPGRFQFQKGVVENVGLDEITHLWGKPVLGGNENLVWC